jgi:nitric oxide dioxygenase
MQSSQAGLVTYSWKRVGPLAERVAGLFYDRLFEIAPAARAQFQADQMPALRRALIGGIDQGIARLGRPAMRGAAPFAAAQDDPLLGAATDQALAALLGTLHAVLGRDWTPPHEAAWRALGPCILDRLRPANVAA